MAGLDCGAAVPVWLSEDDLGCIICQELLKCPATLPCGHSFCRDCLKRQWAAGRPGSCPLCSEGCTKPRDLRKNTLLQDLVDKYRRVVSELDEPPSAAPGPDAPRAPSQQPQPTVAQKNNTVCLELTDLVEQLIDITKNLQRETPEALQNNFEMPQKKTQCVLHQLEEIQRKLLENLKCKKTLEVQPGGERLATSLSCPLPDQKCSAPKRVSRFAQYAIYPTFDQKTLCQYLEMSQDGRTLKVARSRHSYPLSPERFRVSQALASMAFMSGLHYWEVDTQHCSFWSVGVAYENMSRYTVLGQSLDSWCLEWKAPNQLSGWCLLKETRLGSYRPSVVGILLDLDNHTLAFYSVADQKLLFECPALCLHPVCPAFWLYGLDAGNSLTIRLVEK